MTDTLLTTCAIRPAKTTKLCAGCKSVSFCSKEHQKLIWSTHKYACKNSGVWTTKPLTKEEAEALLDERNLVCPEWILQQLIIAKKLDVTGANLPPDRTVVDKLKRLGLFEGKWEDLVSDLSKAVPTMQDPKRSAILSLFRHQLSGETILFKSETGGPLNSEPITNQGPHKLPITPWNHMSETAGRFIEPALTGWDLPLDRDLKLFQQTYPFFQQMLIANTLTFAYWIKKDFLVRRYTLLAFDRAKEMVPAMNLPPLFRTELEEYIRCSRAIVDLGARR